MILEVSESHEVVTANNCGWKPTGMSTQYTEPRSGGRNELPFHRFESAGLIYQLVYRMVAETRFFQESNRNTGLGCGLFEVATATFVAPSGCLPRNCGLPPTAKCDRSFAAQAKLFFRPKGVKSKQRFEFLHPHRLLI
jgi:hypothetical protein